MLNLRNTYISFITLQKVGHKVREEKNIQATETIEYEEAKEEILLPFLLSPFRKKLEEKQFYHYTYKLEFNKVYQLTESMFNEEIDFVDYSNEILKHLYEKSLHPMIKSGEVFIVQFENILFDDIPCRGIAIYKLENKSRFIRFDESNSINYDLMKGYKLDKIDKACLIIDTQKDDGYRVYSVDNKKVESEFWTKNFLEVKPVTNSALQTKNFLEIITDFSNDVVLQHSDKKAQAEFLSNTIEKLSAFYSFVDNEIIEEDILSDYKDEFNQFLNVNQINVDREFEVDSGILITQSKKIKSEIKLDTGAKINLDLLNPDCVTEYLERGFDEEKKMFFYKVYFNSEA